ncbi:hypothetical protein OIU79_002523 [Salix purpurea]|uniref:Uncharacterized protein n=1 Tax=Salix purpurea TaxID=77065 RepID=A0A9Q0UTE9_SALPP|nr:hypothetical protein OIU79_002523 [Salix purpurea]
MELCSTTQRISNHPKTPYHFRPKTSLTLQKTLISPASRRRRLYSRIRATVSEEPNQYVKEDRNGAVAVEESPALTEEATADPVSNEFLDNFNIKVCVLFLSFRGKQSLLFNRFPCNCLFFISVSHQLYSNAKLLL